MARELGPVRTTGKLYLNSSGSQGNELPGIISLDFL